MTFWHFRVGWDFIQKPLRSTPLVLRMRIWNSYLNLPVSPLVDESAKVHHIPDDTVEHDVVPDVDAIILMLAVNAGCDGLKGRGRRKSFADGNLDIYLELVGGFGITKLRFNVVDGLLKLHPKERRRLKPKLS